MSQNVCRWGILGTAAIARKIWKAIRISNNGRVAAVGSRTVSRADLFIAQCSAEVPPSQPVLALGSYQELIEHPEIDAIYIPLPTGMRKEYVIAAAKAGKHVLCEKPVAVHSDDLREMTDACESAGVQFIDGVMFDHSQRWNQWLAEMRAESPIGKVRRIQTHFSFPGDDSFQASNIRVDANLEPHGCLGDLGWYCIRFTLGITNGVLPKTVSAKTLTPLQGEASDASVPGEMAGEFVFDGGMTAGFYCSFLTANQQTALVSGDEGYVSFDDFVLPLFAGQTSLQTHRHDLLIDNCRWNFRRRSERTCFDEFACGESGAQEVNLVERLATAANSGKVEKRFHDIALKTQLILDACRRSDAADGSLVQIEL